MKKLVILVALAAIVIYGCKKSSSTDNSNVTCKLLKTIITANGTTVSTFYSYNSSGKINLVWKQNGKSDTVQSRKYVYSGNNFSYSIGKDDSGNIDTTYYTYDGSNRIIVTLKRNHNTGKTLKTATHFTYNGSNQVTLTNTQSTLDDVNFTYDSIVYQYNLANVAGYSQYTKVGSGSWTQYQVNFGYDGQSNYYKTTGEPEISYEYWSVNNLSQFFKPDSTTAYATYNFTNYTATHYPQNFTETFNPSQPNNQISGTLSYQCQ